MNDINSKQFQKISEYEKKMEDVRNMFFYVKNLKWA